jgi:transposase
MRVEYARRTDTPEFVSVVAAAPAIQRWLLQHPRFQLHFTPTYSSWINQVERWFAELTRNQLRRSGHRSTRALEDTIRLYLATSNDDPRPFVWIKTADDILASIQRFCYELPAQDTSC